MIVDRRSLADEGVRPTCFIGFGDTSGFMERSQMLLACYP
jgi:hypothetical protein